jgi:hypothetical protein
MSAIATISPSQRAGGPGWCSTGDIDKSREIAIENRALSTLVIFPNALSPAAQHDAHNGDRIAVHCLHAVWPVAARDASDVSDATIITAGQFIVLKKWKLVDDPSPGRSAGEGVPIPRHVRLVGISASRRNVGKR